MEVKPELFEKLGAFYLGREYDLDGGEMSDELVLYDSKDLTTHAVCVGMTGSGKTGLCVSLLEEAAIDGVPAIVIDPKGDISNLLLTFPGLEASDFRPWINEDAARQAGVSPDEYAAAQADLWRSGLASWGQDGARIRRLREAVDVTIYTPGSEAGVPVSILRSFDAPPPAILDDGDAFRERVSSTVTSVLGLVGIESDPLNSREHILLSTVMDRAWRSGRPMDLATLIQAIQDPDIDRIGVMDMESFYPAKDRFELAMRLNNLLASPGFSTWMSGAPLDVDAMLYGPAGSPRVALFSIAHLGDQERMFFVSLLLNQTLGWMRTKTGTSSLRALLYIDELFGFMPPVANPPSKQPLLTMLKQARAFGLGLLLATQNPMDLDYKGLSNTGTWFIGRLQTERDKARILEGLESAKGTGLSKAELDRLISRLDKRVFLLHNVHERAPVTFHTRWAMSYLAGPLTRTQIRDLMQHKREGFSTGAARTQRSTSSSPPVLPPDVEQRFVPALRAGGKIEYRPCAYGAARVHLVKTRDGLAHDEIVHMLCPVDERGGVTWSGALTVAIPPGDLETKAADGASFEALPAGVGTEDTIRQWSDAFEESLYRTRRLDVFEFAPLGIHSEPGEFERDFRIRIADSIREVRDKKVEELRGKNASRFARLDERLRKAEQKVAREEEQADSAKMQSIISAGATVLSAVLGRKTLTRSTIGRATTTARGWSRSQSQGQDVDRAEDDRDAILHEIEALNAELENAVDELEIRLDPKNVELATETLKPRRTDIDVQMVALAWVPYRDDEPAWR